MMIKADHIIGRKFFYCAVDVLFISFILCLHPDINHDTRILSLSCSIMIYFLYLLISSFPGILVL